MEEPSFYPYLSGRNNLRYFQGIGGTEGLENSFFGRGRGRSLRQSLLLRTPLRGPCGPCGSGDSLLCGGMGVGLGYYFFEQIFLGIFINLFDWFQNVADFLLIYNIGA